MRLDKNMNYNRLKDGKYCIELKKDMDVMMDNENNICFQHFKKYIMIIKDGICYIKRNCSLKEYYICTPYMDLPDFFNIEEII